MMSPPSWATAGRTRVSISSRIWAVSSSSSPTGAAAAVSSSRIGRLAVRCSMMTPRMAGFITCQLRPSPLVTVTKSAPRKTPVTPSTWNSRVASGERSAFSALVKSAVPLAMMLRPGRNLSVAGFGVCSVSMNKGTSMACFGQKSARPEYLHGPSSPRRWVKAERASTPKNLWLFAGRGPISTRGPIYRIARGPRLDAVVAGFDDRTIMDTLPDSAVTPIDWLLRVGRLADTTDELLGGLCDLLVAQGLPLERVGI